MAGDSGINLRATQLDLPLPEPTKVVTLDICRGVTIRNPEAFNDPEIQQLFADAFAPREERKFANPIAAIEWCYQHCQDPQVAVMIAVSQEKTPRGLCVAEFSPGVWTLGPWVLHYYSTGLSSLKALCGECVPWLRSIGQDRVFGLNQMTRSDDVHARLFRSHFDGAKFASLNEFIIRED